MHASSGKPRELGVYDKSGVNISRHAAIFHIVFIRDSQLLASLKSTFMTIEAHAHRPFIRAGIAWRRRFHFAKFHFNRFAVLTWYGIIPMQRIDDAADK